MIQVIESKIKRYSLPKTGVLKDGSTVSGYRLLDGGAASNEAHSHTITAGSMGSGTAHNNMQPYITTYMFRRTA